MGERKRETVKEREGERDRGGSERERERLGEYENREGKEKSRKKTDVLKLFAYNKCEHSVRGKFFGAELFYDSYSTFNLNVCT